MADARTTKGLLEAARAAHREKQWPEAERLWRQYVDAAPAQPAGHINLGLTLFALGRLDEAGGCAAHVQARWPERVEGWVLGARVATNGADAVTRLAAWMRVTEKFPDNVAACNEHGRALFDGERWTDAATLAVRLLKLDRRLGLHLQGRVQDKLHPDADHTDFWQTAAAAFPDDIDFRRKAVQAALWAGRKDEATAQFKDLVAAGNARLADVNFVIGLANLHRANGDAAALRATVRSYFAATMSDPEYRLAALKLSRVVFGDFPKVPVDAATVPCRFAEMVKRAPLSGSARDWLGEAQALSERALQVSPRSLLETDVARMQCKAFIAGVRDHLASGKPVSLIRLGDGESNALGYAAAWQPYLQDDMETRERIWWGAPLSSDARDALNARVRDAVWNADILGIPCAGRAVRDLDLKADVVMQAGRSGRGLRAVMDALVERLNQPAPYPVFVSSHLHQDLYKHALYASLFHGLEGVIVVSSHSALPQLICDRFGARSASGITIRAAHNLTVQLRNAGSASDTGYVLPEQLEDAAAALPEDMRGRLVIVAAGYAGKCIVSAAKQRGAVALDLGSIADYWMGARTRSYLDLA
jgi:tetratricopeptide (TPR) repeat protein